MLRAAGRLVLWAIVVAAIGLALSALLALVLSGGFMERFRITVWLPCGLLVLLAASGGSPSMQRSVDRSFMGRAPTHGDYDAPRVSTSAVLILAAAIVLAVGIAVDS